MNFEKEKEIDLVEIILFYSIQFKNYFDYLKEKTKEQGHTNNKYFIKKIQREKFLRLVNLEKKNFLFVVKLVANKNQFIKWVRKMFACLFFFFLIVFFYGQTCINKNFVKTEI